jgi:signal peptidase II
LKRPLLIIFLILLIDQAVKFWVKTHMYLGQEFRFADWAIIHFTENNGMAFGMEFGGAYGKLALSVFRIFFVVGIFWYLSQLVKEKANSFYITCIAMVIAGAAGNIIDSTFYGVWFSGSDFQLASFLPANGGYSSLLHGKVVDMFYFPLLQGQYPSWMPLWGGEEFLFFRPVFNVADASISMGVILMIVFQKRVFGQMHDQNEQDVNPAETPSSEEHPSA